MKKGIVKTETPENVEYIIDAGVVIDNYNKKNPELRRMTQVRLAGELDVTPQLLSDWKRGRVVQTVQILKKMSEIGGCTVDELIKPFIPKSDKK